MPYKDPERQRLANRANTQKWYQTRKTDEAFLDHRAATRRQHTKKATILKRARDAALHEGDVIATINQLPKEPNEKDSTSTTHGS
jgi:hypothetical protein